MGMTKQEEEHAVDYLYSYIYDKLLDHFGEFVGNCYYEVKQEIEDLTEEDYEKVVDIVYKKFNF
jgi:hypothetical protein